MSEHFEAIDLDRLEAVLAEEVGAGRFVRMSLPGGETYFRALAKGEPFCLEVEVVPTDNKVRIVCSVPFCIDPDDADYDSPTAAVLKQLNNLNRHEGALSGIVCTVSSSGLVEFSSNNVSAEEVPKALRTTITVAAVHTKKLAEIVFGGWILPNDVRKIGGEALAKALLGDAMLLYSAEFGNKTRTERAIDAWRLRFETKEGTDDE